MKKHILGIAIITLISVTAQAEDSTTIPFYNLATTRTDFLSTDEAGVLPGIATQWFMMDKNNDGQLNRAEYADYQIPAPAAGIN